MLWERNIISQYVCKGCIAILALERSSTEQHLIDQNAEGPPIYRTGMATSFDNLWCNILLRTNE